MADITEAPQTEPQRSDHQIDVADHPTAARWLKETARRNPEGFLRLVGNNQKRLTALYGLPRWKSDGKHGWHAAWSLTDHGLSWVVLTGPDGTIFRLRVPGDGDDHLNDARVGVGITRYLNTLLHELNRDLD